MPKQIIIFGDKEKSKKFLHGSATLLHASHQTKYSFIHLPAKETFEITLFDINTVFTSGLGSDAHPPPEERLKAIDAFIVIFSVIDRSSFANIHALWRSLLIRFSAPLIIIGTDVEFRNDNNANHIQSQETKAHASIWGSKFYCECSSEDSKLKSKILEITTLVAENPNRHYANISTKITLELDLNSAAPPHEIRKSSLPTSPRVTDMLTDNSARLVNEIFSKQTCHQTVKENKDELAVVAVEKDKVIRTSDNPTVLRSRALSIETVPQQTEDISSPLDTVLNLFNTGLGIFNPAPPIPSKSLPMAIAKNPPAAQEAIPFTHSASPTSPKPTAKIPLPGLTSSLPQPTYQSTSPENTPPLGSGRVKAIARKLKSDKAQSPPSLAHNPKAAPKIPQFKK